MVVPSLRGMFPREGRATTYIAPFPVGQGTTAIGGIQCPECGTHFAAEEALRRPA